MRVIPMSQIRARQGSRRGAVLVMVALLLTVLLGIGAFAVDLSQVMAHRSELQRAADAAALAGAVRLTTTSFDAADNDAVTYSVLNPIMGGTDSIAVDYGSWNGSSFSERGADAHDTDAIKVTLFSTSPSIFAQVLGVGSTSVQAEATAWASPNVELTDCVKPFAIPFQALTGTIDQNRGLGVSGNPNRDTLTQRDLFEVRSNPTLLKFCLKEGEVCDTSDTLGRGGHPSSFLVVDLGGGSTAVQANIKTCVMTGNPAQRRLLGWDSVLTVLSGNYASEVANGTCPRGVCAQRQGSPPWCEQFGPFPCVMKVALYDDGDLLCVPNTGQCKIHLIASIVITGIRSGTSSVPRAILDGYFTATIDHGNVGNVSSRRTTLMRPILVQ